jgi:hypothetical protein
MRPLSVARPHWRFVMELILFVVVLILLFGGGGYWGRRRGHWSPLTLKERLTV